MKNYKVIIILGNFGVGKSTLLEKIYDEDGLKESFFCGVKQQVQQTMLQNSVILGNNKKGADSLATEKKNVVRRQIVNANKNVFVAGLFYIADVDFDFYIKNGLIPIFIKLKTSKHVNRQRMKERSGAKLKEATWAVNENRFCRIERYAEKKGLSFEEIDNDQTAEEVFKDFLLILQTINFET